VPPQGPGGRGRDGGRDADAREAAAALERRAAQAECDLAAARQDSSTWQRRASVLQLRLESAAEDDAMLRTRERGALEAARAAAAQAEAARRDAAAAGEAARAQHAAAERLAVQLRGAEARGRELDARLEAAAERAAGLERAARDAAALARTRLDAAEVRAACAAAHPPQTFLYVLGRGCKMYLLLPSAPPAGATGQHTCSQTARWQCMARTAWQARSLSRLLSGPAGAAAAGGGGRGARAGRGGARGAARRGHGRAPGRERARGHHRRRPDAGARPLGWPALHAEETLSVAGKPRVVDAHLAWGNYLYFFCTEGAAEGGRLQMPHSAPLHSRSPTPRILMPWSCAGQQERLQTLADRAGFVEAELREQLAEARGAAAAELRRRADAAAAEVDALRHQARPLGARPARLAPAALGARAVARPQCSAFTVP